MAFRPLKNKVKPLTAFREYKTNLSAHLHDIITKRVQLKFEIYLFSISKTNAGKHSQTKTIGGHKYPLAYLSSFQKKVVSTYRNVLISSRSKGEMMLKL